MFDDEFGSLNVTVRVYENELLTQSIYDRMLAADSFEEAVGILRETSYRDEVEEVLKTHNYDDMITENLVRLYDRLFQISPSPEIVELATLRYSYHNIKVMLKEMIADKDLEDLYFPIGRYDLTELRQAVSLGQSEVLPEEYLQTIRSAKLDYSEFGNIQQVEVLVDRHYFEHLKQIAVTIGDPEIIELVDMQIDFKNISTLIRAKYQDRTPNFLRSVLSDAGSLDVETLIQMGSKDARTLIQSLLETQYKSILSESMITAGIGISSIKFDYYTDNAMMRKMQEAKLKAFGPLPMIAYIYAKETEARNLRLVLSAKENHIDVEETKERMRMNYVS
ncbi:V-type ATPase subunit [Fundicoccus culcitae]|uniref:V-type ATPase subunit n=1 Tax=Fundicoccus culcitae TaxID=2969821 RepID=A0ABY5P519_9LACT|nr:V-type ATPase subunit [Fundicoccus culcitae]UUX33644.1 V-type ATPase subunit [Fundicoccus culcitae]